jgi:hypothetical protein
MNNFFVLDKPEPKWGDYSDILIHGMSCHLGRSGKRIQLERAGPYVPPISFPGISDIVVTNEFKKLLEISGLSGLKFQPVIKKQIVELDWQKWDQNAEEPFEYPEEGEPENYILGKPHSPKISEQIGNLWEVVLEKVCKADPGYYSIFLDSSSWGGQDLFIAQNRGYIFITEKAKVWFEQNAKQHVAFKKVTVR